MTDVTYYFIIIILLEYIKITKVYYQIEFNYYNRLDSIRS